MKIRGFDNAFACLAALITLSLSYYVYFNGAGSVFGLPIGFFDFLPIPRVENEIKKIQSHYHPDAINAYAYSSRIAAIGAVLFAISMAIARSLNFDDAADTAPFLVENANKNFLIILLCFAVLVWLGIGGAFIGPEMIKTPAEISASKYKIGFLAHFFVGL
ncbi:MAG: hypothetical protein ACPGGK_04325 [Pikeienuella sp.]